jgi:MFS family permease
MPNETHPSDRGRNAAIGCLMFPIGAVSGAMIAVLVSKIVAEAVHAPSCPDIPTCDWYVYAGIGALLGALTLPVLVIRRLLQRAPADTNQRG